MINKHLTQKGASWPLYAAVSAYAMNTFPSTTLQGLSPFKLVFARKPQQLTSFELPKLSSFPVEYRNFLGCYWTEQKCIGTWIWNGARCKH